MRKNDAGSSIRAGFCLLILLFSVEVKSEDSAKAEQDSTKEDIQRAIEILEKAIETGTPLTDISKECPPDMVPQPPEYYSDNPETQKYCVANPCHCL